MKRIGLIHWNATEAAARTELLRAAGYAVFEIAAPRALRSLQTPLDAVVIDLSRLPMQGRDVGIGIRHRKSTRQLPLVFVDGERDKVARVREQLPDAVYTRWKRIDAALERALTRPPAVTTAPASVLAGYSCTPLPKKLGIKPGSRVALDGAPRGFETVLGELPAGASLQRRSTRNLPDLTLWFVRSRAELRRGIRGKVARGAGGGLWILWPKQTSTLAGDLRETDVREIGLAAGLVDFKVCAVDATWSGLRFSRRKPG